MASYIDTTEYMYCSPRIRSLENDIFGAEAFGALAEASSVDEIFSRLAERGVELKRDPDGSVNAEATVEGIFDDACYFISSVTPKPELYDFLRYPYDCNNLKAALKCYFRKTDATSMLYSCGTVDKQFAAKAVAGEKTAYPINMSRAVVEAMNVFSKTKNPQQIDTILDSALYKDMLECAKGSGCGLFVDLVKTRLTLTNIMTCIRLMRMNMGQAGRAILSDAVLPGGVFDEKFFLSAYDEGEGRLYDMLEFTDYGKFAAAAREQKDRFFSIEKTADDIYMELAKKAKMIPFGPEVAAGYLIAREYEVKNLRIILNAKRAGESAEIIRERLRACYV